MGNDKLYIHEFIDIIGHNRARYMQHMAANWSPEAQEQRKQRCYGVWAALGSTGRWPEVVNLWEHDGWEGMAASFAVEATGSGAQDPTLERWWAKAAEFRRGGIDRILVPAPWTRSIEELCADEIRGECYAHELVRVRAGAAADYLETVREQLSPLREHFRWQLAGAWRTAMVNDDECVVLWTIPTWQDWADFEQTHDRDAGTRNFRSDNDPIVRQVERIVLIDAPLSPLCTGRQPSRDDRSDFVQWS